MLIDLAKPLAPATDLDKSQGRVTSRCANTHRIFVLSDGRQMEYLEYGDPTGRAVIYNHGMPGSGLEASVLDPLFKEAGLRLICPNRPGVGKSSPIKHYHLAQITRDLLQLVEYKQLNDITLIGWSSGGVPALWQSRYLADQARQVILLSSYSHFDELDACPEARYGQAQQLKWLLNRLPRTSRLLNFALSVLAKVSHKNYLKAVMKQLAPQDQKLFGAAHLQLPLLASHQQALTNNRRVMFQDLLSQFQPWPFPLNSIKTPVTIFQGTKDPFISERIGQHLADSLPNSEYCLLQDQAHMYWLKGDFQQDLVQLCLKEPNKQEPR